jgi:hypothetical protein
VHDGEEKLLSVVRKGEKSEDERIKSQQRGNAKVQFFFLHKKAL